MEKEGQMATIVASLLMITVYFEVAEGQCEFDRDHNGCPSKMIWLVDNDILKNKWEFTIIYRSAGNEEIIAECDWLTGNFKCDEVEGFIHDGSDLSEHFSISIDTTTRCLKSGSFVFDSSTEKHCDIPNSAQSQDAHSEMIQDKPKNSPESQETIQDKKERETSETTANIQVVAGSLVVFGVALLLSCWKSLKKILCCH